MMSDSELLLFGSGPVSRDFMDYLAGFRFIDEPILPCCVSPGRPWPCPRQHPGRL
jgi:hypothetical protein